MLDPSDTDAFYNDTSPPDVHHAAVGVPRAASVCNVTKSNSSHLLPGAYSNALANSLSSARSCMPNDSDVLRGNQPCAEPVKAKAAEAKCFPDAGPCFGRPLRLDGQMDFAERTAGDGGKQNANFAVSQLHGVYLSFQKLVASRTVSWKAFFHLPSFERPRTGATVVDRIERNFRYFYMNYLLICSALAVVAALLNPVVLLVAGACGGAAIAAGLRGETVRLGSTVVPLRTFRVGCAAVGALTVLLVAGHIVAVLLFACTVVVLLHASLHVGVSYEQLAQRAADDAAFEV